MPDFVKLVSEMRTAQKQYFKTRDRAWLQKAQSIERQVDAALTEHYQKGNLVV